MNDRKFKLLLSFINILYTTFKNKLPQKIQITLDQILLELNKEEN